MMSGQPFRRDLTDLDHDAIRRRRALDYAVAELQRAANALQAAGNGGLRDSVLTDAYRQLESMQRELRALE
jgi:hypothetical protein